MHPLSLTVGCAARGVSKRPRDTITRKNLCTEHSFSHSFPSSFLLSFSAFASRLLHSTWNDYLRNFKGFFFFFGCGDSHAFPAEDSCRHASRLKARRQHLAPFHPSFAEAQGSLLAIHGAVERIEVSSDTLGYISAQPHRVQRHPIQFVLVIFIDGEAGKHTVVERVIGQSTAAIHFMPGQVIARGTWYFKGTNTLEIFQHLLGTWLGSISLIQLHVLKSPAAVRACLMSVIILNVPLQYAAVRSA